MQLLSSDDVAFSFTCHYSRLVANKIVANIQMTCLLSWTEGHSKQGVRDSWPHTRVILNSQCIWQELTEGGFHSCQHQNYRFVFALFHALKLRTLYLAKPSPLPWQPKQKQVPKARHWNPVENKFSHFTLLWRTTTLCGSALSHVSMALQILHIFSRAGVWKSGQPKSSTCNTKREKSTKQEEKQK